MGRCWKAGLQLYPFVHRSNLGFRGGRRVAVQGTALDATAAKHTHRLELLVTQLYTTEEQRYR